MPCQLQIAVNSASRNVFSVEGVLSSFGKNVKADTQPFMNLIFDRGVNVVGICSDFSYEQKIVTPEHFIRFWDSIHTTTNIWQNIICKHDAFFSFNGGRILNAHRAHLVLIRTHHDELADFERIFRPISDLANRTKAFVFFVRSNLPVRLVALCEAKLLEEGASEEWEDLLRFSQLIVTLGIILKISFLNTPLNERKFVYASCLIRVLKYDFKNATEQNALLYTSSLSNSILFMRRHELEPHTDIFFKSSLYILESIKYQLKKSRIVDIGVAQRFYALLAQGATILNLDSPFGFMKRVICTPSEPLIV